MTSKKRSNNIWKFVDDYLKMDKKALTKSIAHHLEFSVCKNRRTLRDIDIY